MPEPAANEKSSAILLSTDKSTKLTMTQEQFEQIGNSSNPNNDYQKSSKRKSRRRQDHFEAEIEEEI